MKFTFLSALLCLVFLNTQAQTAYLSWGYQFGGTNGSNNAMPVAHDVSPSGNHLTVGEIRGTIDLNGGSGAQSYTSAGLDDVYIQKVNQDGGFVWAKAIGNAQANFPCDVAVDQQENVFVVMKFNGTLDVDPGNGMVNVSSVGSFEQQHDLLLLKLDASGNYVDHIKMDTTLYDSQNAELAVGSDNMLYFVYNKIGSRIRVSKWDPSDLSLVWEKEIGAVNSGFFQVNSFSLDASDNIVIGGRCSQTVFMNAANPGQTQSLNGTNIDWYVLKWNSDGEYQWGHMFGSSSNDEELFDLHTDLSGNVFVSGAYSTTTDFNPASGTNNLTALGGRDAFLLKLNANGVYQWAKSIGSASDDVAGEIAATADGSLGVVFYLTADTDVDPGAGVANVTVSTYSIVFVKYDSAGNYEWFHRLGLGDVLNDPVELNTTSEAIYISGTYSGAGFDGDPSSTLYSVSSSSNAYAYLLKWSECTPSSATLNVNACNSYTLNGTTYSQSGAYQQVLENEAGTCDSILTLNLIISPEITPSISIVASTNNICNSTTVVFTASTVGEGETPQYAWYVNNALTGTASSFVSNALSPGDVVYCQLTSSLECASAPTANSNAITMVCQQGNGDLFFSEYLEGSGNSKAVEIFNPSGATVDLSEYSIALYSNGSATATNTYNLSGTLAPADVLVVANAQAAAEILAVANVTNAVCSFNGDDAVALLKNDIPIDVVGEIGVDPGTNWTVDGGGATSEFTLVRKPEVDAPTTDWTIGATQWIVLQQNTTDSLGQHTMQQVDPLQNPSVGISASSIAICEGENTTFSSELTDAGVNPIIQWYVNDNLVQNMGTTFSTSDLENGDIVTCTVISDPDGVLAQSNAITMEVYPIPNNAVVLNDTVLTAVQMGAVYQWFDCTLNEALMGENESTLNVPYAGSFEVVIALNGCVATSDCVEVVLDGVEESSDIQWSIYPNPAHDVAMIRSTRPITSIEVWDVAGRLIRSDKMQSPALLSPMHPLAPGCYLVRINQSHSTRLVVE